MSMRGLLFILCIIVFALNNSAGQNPIFVGQIGSHQSKYEKTVNTNPIQLLEVCNNNLDSAYQIWVDVMYDFEKFAEAANYDLKGLKLWVHIFVIDGKIRELYYHPKPNSRNTDYTKVTSLLEKFVNL